MIEYFGDRNYLELIEIYSGHNINPIKILEMMTAPIFIIESFNDKTLIFLEEIKEPKKIIIITEIIKVSTLNTLKKLNHSIIFLSKDEFKKVDSYLNKYIKDESKNLKVGKNIINVPQENILYIEMSQGKKCKIKFITDETIEVRETLTNLEEALSRYPSFKRIDRSTIINKKFIVFLNLEEEFIRLKNGEMLYFSRKILLNVL